MWSRLDGEVGLIEGVWPRITVLGELSELLVNESEGIVENTGESGGAGDADESGKIDEAGDASESDTTDETDSTGDISDPDR